MSEPFIFIGTHTLREGKLEDFKKACRAQGVERQQLRWVALGRP
jgi:hypothetical protein